MGNGTCCCLSLALRQSACHVAPHVCKRTFTAGWDQVSWPNEIIRCYTQDVGNRSKKRWRITYRCKKEPKYVNKCSLAVVGVWVKTYCQREPWFLIIAQLFADILHASITSFTDWHVVWLKKISWLDSSSKMPDMYDIFYKKSFVCLHPAVICSLPLHPPPHPTYLNHISLSRLRIDKGQTFSSPLFLSFFIWRESLKLCLYDWKGAQAKTAAKARKGSRAGAFPARCAAWLNHVQEGVRYLTCFKHPCACWTGNIQGSSPRQRSISFSLWFCL